MPLPNVLHGLERLPRWPDVDLSWQIATRARFSCIQCHLPFASVAAVSTEQEQDNVKPQPHRCSLFHDEQLNSFFRRLAWSPDGVLSADLSSSKL